MDGQDESGNRKQGTGPAVLRLHSRHVYTWLQQDAGADLVRMVGDVCLPILGKPAFVINVEIKRSDGHLACRVVR